MQLVGLIRLECFSSRQASPWRATLFVGPADCNHCNCHRKLCQSLYQHVLRITRATKQDVTTVVVFTGCWSYESFTTFEENMCWTGCVGQVTRPETFMEFSTIGSHNWNSQNFKFRVCSPRGLHPSPRSKKACVEHAALDRWFPLTVAISIIIISRAAYVQKVGNSRQTMET